MNSINAENLLGLARNFMESRILLTGAEMDLFTFLTPAPLSVREIAEKKKADSRGLAILLDALAAMNLLVKEAEKYQCPRLGLPISFQGRSGIGASHGSSHGPFVGTMV